MSRLLSFRLILRYDPDSKPAQEITNFGSLFLMIHDTVDSESESAAWWV